MYHAMKTEPVLN